MSDFGLDFGLFVAYFVPGVIALIGLTNFSDRAREVQEGITGKEMSAGAFVVGTVVVLMLGMSLSILRFATVDASFRVKIPGLAPPMKRVDPDYKKLITEGRLSAYMEAKAEDKRPYQFYGSTLLALMLVAAGVLVRAPLDSKREDPNPGRGPIPGAPNGGQQPGALSRQRPAAGRGGRVLVALGIILVGVAVLYPAARQSHFRFMRTVESLNHLPPVEVNPRNSVQ